MHLYLCSTERRPWGGSTDAQRERLIKKLEGEGRILAWVGRRVGRILKYHVAEVSCRDFRVEDSRVLMRSRKPWVMEESVAAGDLQDFPGQCDADFSGRRQ